jgi:hypothetical protein
MSAETGTQLVFTTQTNQSRPSFRPLDPFGQKLSHNGDSATASTGHQSPCITHVTADNPRHTVPIWRRSPPSCRT